MEITTELVFQLAEMTRLEMSPQEAESYRKDLKEILEYFRNLDEVDTSAVAPTERIFEGYAELGEDVPAPSFPVEELARMAGPGFEPDPGVFVLQGVLPTAR